MKKGKQVAGGKNIPIFVFIFLLILAVIALGYLTGFFGKITGYLGKNVGLNITIGAPLITAVYNQTLLSISPNPGPAPTGIIINFTAYHGAGSQYFNDSTAKVNITMTNEITRENGTCMRYQSSTNYVNYTCNVTMWWFDGAGVWNIVASILDNNTNVAYNNTANFTLGLVTGFDISPANLTWLVLGPGATNQTSNNDPLELNNTGNQPIGLSTSNISINATNLRGEVTNTQALWAGNFSVHWDNGTSSCTGAACTECGGTKMNSGLYTNITGANLTKGNYTINDDKIGQETLYFCLRFAGNELSSQAYSNKNESVWTIKI